MYFRTVNWDVLRLFPVGLMVLLTALMTTIRAEYNISGISSKHRTAL